MTQSNMNKKREYIGVIYIIISALLFGVMPLLAKLAYQHGSNAYTVAFGRFGFGCIILFFIILSKPNCSITISKKELIQILRLSFTYALTPVLLYTSYQYIDSGLATTLHFTYPVSVIIILALFFHQKPDKKQIICTFICMAGILMLYRPNTQTNLFGVLLAVSSGIVYSIYIVLLGRGELKSVSVLTLSFWLSLFASLEIGCVALITGRMKFDLDIIAWGTEILLALLATVLALMLFQKGLFLCGEIKSSLLSTFEPLTGILIGVFVLNEQLIWQDFIGIVFIFISVVVLVVKRGNRQKEKHTQYEFH